MQSTLNFSKNLWSKFPILFLCFWTLPSLATSLAEPGPPEDEFQTLTATDRQIQSLGCLTVGTAVGATTVLLGSTGIAFLGLRGAATATTVAIPVLMTTVAAGCAFGTQAALGIQWMHHNRKILLEKWKALTPKLDILDKH